MKGEKVFAIQTDKLWSYVEYKENGLIRSSADVLDEIVREGLFDYRENLENNPGFKQIIPYALISNEDSCFLFRRTAGQTEKRLHNKFSLGVGGHMNPNGETDSEYLIRELKRELFEEVILDSGCEINGIEFIGFINDDTNSVGSVHIGLLYNIHLSSAHLSINEKDKMTGEWVPKAKLSEYYDPMETWTRIAYDFYLK
jgi:predicted NUDIX family phosphoesterase